VAVKHYPIVYPNVLSIGKEVVKLVWPGQKSRLKYLLSPKYKVDMFIRARKVA